MKKVRSGFLSVLSIFVFLFLPSVMMYAGTAPSLELLNPERGEDIPYGESLVIAVSIYDPDGDVDTSSIELELDRREVTQDANVSALLVTYTAEEMTAAGKHTFSLFVKDREGNEATLVSFFNVAPRPKKDRKYTLNGKVRVGSEYDKEASKPFTAVTNVNLFGNLYDTVDYSVSVDLANEEATDGQRLSTYRLDLYSPLGGAVLGDATPSFSKYTIDGMRVFGVHLLPQFGPFGMELVYGKSAREVEDPPTFKRHLYGGKLKLGRERSFLWGLSFLKAKDDKDSLTTTETTPKDNIVLGTDFKLTLLRGLVRFWAEANQSLLNDDITEGAGLGDDSEVDLPLDPEDWEWFFTINEHIVPILPGWTSLAARTWIKVGPLYDNTLELEYSYIGPSYNSLGNTSIVNDKAGIRLSDTQWLLDQRLFLSLAFQRYRDNLEDTLEETTRTTGIGLNTYVYPNDYLSVNGGFDLFTVSDSETVDSVNTTISTGVSRSFELYTTSSRAYFDGNVALVRDDIDSSNDLTDFGTRAGLVSYFDTIPLDTRFVLGYDFGDSPNSFYIRGRGGYRFLKDETLYAYADLVYQTAYDQFNLEIGSTFETVYEIVVEATVEYFTSSVSSDLVLSAFATMEF